MSDRDRGYDDQLELPPPFQKMLDQLKADRKTLLRDKAYSNPDQLRAFMGQYLFSRLHDIVELFGITLYDTYNLSVSNANQLQRLRATTAKELRKLGADTLSEDEELPGPSTEVLDELQQSFYALGTLLVKKLPEDEEVQEAYNRCTEALSDLTAEMMGISPDEQADDAEDDADPEESDVQVDSDEKESD